MPLSRNEFDSHENELVSERHCHKNDFALRLVFTQRQTRTRKWATVMDKEAGFPILCLFQFVNFVKVNDVKLT